MKNLAIIFVFILLVSNSVIAQNKNVLNDLDYNNEYTFGFNLNTNGDILGGFCFKYSNRVKSNIFNAYTLELLNVKNPKEYNAGHDSSINNFIFGKQNYLFVIRPQFGKEIVLFRKENGEGVQMNLMLAAGPSFGIVKPYYIYYGNSASSYVTVPYNANTTNSYFKTYGSTGFFDGLLNSKMVLGLSMKVSCLFEFGAFSHNLTGAEIGFMTEAFSKKIIIMDKQENKSVFFSAFLNIYFGVRE